MIPPPVLVNAHKQAYGRPPTHIASAPGRVNLLGDHVDYNAGLALPCAIEPRAWVSGSPGSRGQLELLALDFDETFSIDLEQLYKGPHAMGSAPRWAYYSAGVAWSLAQQGIAVPGVRCVIYSDVPVGSGLSSSAAIEVAAANLLLALAGSDLGALQIARACQMAENEFVGVQSGLMDQWTSAAAQAGSLILLDFADLFARFIPFPPGISIVVAYSGVQRSLAESHYNQRVAECRQALEELRKRDPTIESLRDIGVERLDWARNQLSELLFNRVNHVTSETERVRQGTRLLEQSRLDEFGELMNASHASLRDLYEVSISEVEALIRAARSDPACLGARLTGAGFGGCTVQLLPQEHASLFMEDLAHRYRAETGLAGRLWAWQPGAGAAAIEWN